jgi:hypothetical protein
MRRLLDEIFTDPGVNELIRRLQVARAAEPVTPGTSLT